MTQKEAEEIVTLFMRHGLRPLTRISPNKRMNTDAHSTRPARSLGAGYARRWALKSIKAETVLMQIVPTRQRAAGRGAAGNME
jgi:hypothetical protein